MPAAPPQGAIFGHRHLTPSPSPLLALGVTYEPIQDVEIHAGWIGRAKRRSMMRFMATWRSFDLNLECPRMVRGFMTQTTKQGVRKSMLRKLVIGALGAMAVMFSTTAFAQGTAADAKAMLEKTVAALKADKAKA